MAIDLKKLGNNLEGKLFTDEVLRTLYATDASVYRELPLAVAFPAHEQDVKRLIDFARTNHVPLIPRTAGTSLAGQVVGAGIVVDVSRTFTQILEINKEEQWVRVQPGVVRDELNQVLAAQGLFFGPETSTSNRAMIGGMVGNNSSGAHSLVYGSTRDQLLEVKGFLADGSYVTFGEIDPETFHHLSQSRGTTLERRIYQQIDAIYSDPANRENIEGSFPKPGIHRRNTGYALDAMACSSPYTEGGPPLNLAKLVAGSEGTLMFLTEIKLKCAPLPPPHKGLLCAHFDTVDEALQANLIALKHEPVASELMDAYLLECTKNNIEQRKNRFFLKGDPGALLLVEVAGDSASGMEDALDRMIREMQSAGLGYHFPVVSGDDIQRVWTLRKAGLGVLANIPGDAKPVAVIEDTAVDVHDLPAYISEFNQITSSLGISCVHYAHAGSGELHLRPVINLKTREGQKLFRTIAEEIARLVKKYRGSLSGEHGDGRLRGEFIRYMVGVRNYELMRDLKNTWDTHHIFNPGKIVDAPPMDASLRYWPGIETPDIETVFDFSREQGIVRAAEFCTGSGDCRKTHVSGGTMCPSYMVTRDERHTTRARANILREYLRKPYVRNRFNHYEIYEIMELCLSCKACKSECPSSVDVTKLKAEFLQHYYDANGIPLRTQMIARFAVLNKWASILPAVYNFFVHNNFFGPLLKRMMGFSPRRSLPLLHNTTLEKWIQRHPRKANDQKPVKGTVYLLIDEFSNFNDVAIGQKAVKLLESLGYDVLSTGYLESGRTWLSKGLLRKAAQIAQRNVEQLKGQVTPETPLVGIEPSALLTLRDEYVDLVSAEMKEPAKELAKQTFLFDEFLAMEVEKGKIDSNCFIPDSRKIKLHGHCHQKALGSLEPAIQMLQIPVHYKVEAIPSGCCGMAGSFGYEKEHFDLSMEIGELVLFPAVREKEAATLVAAPGTSCRHQIKDGTGQRAYHPIEILYDALKPGV